MHQKNFASRHIGPDAGETSEMLNFLGVSSLSELVEEVVPAAIRREWPDDLKGLSEPEWLAYAKQLASKNKLATNFIGQGYYGTYTPSPILRNIFENPGWYTAYTPYQAEIAQGRMEAILNFQTMVMDLTGMELANASLLDEGTAAAEAMAMAFAIRSKAQQQSDSVKFFVADHVFSQTKSVLNTRAEPLGIKLVSGDWRTFNPEDGYFGALIQYPCANGVVEDFSRFAADCQAAEVKVVVAADLLALTRLKEPGAWGADVVVGTSQRLGVPMGYGGPHAAFFATRKAYQRHIPGRIIGITVDAMGKPAMRMALQTREQHIRRDKATSNICTAQALLAIMASMYAVYHGPNGLEAIASEVQRKAYALRFAIEQLGYVCVEGMLFDTIEIRGLDSEWYSRIAYQAKEQDVNLFCPDNSSIRISVDETTTLEHLNELLHVLASAAGKAGLRLSETSVNEIDVSIPSGLKRESAFLTHPVFNSHHSESELMRYIKQLESKDIALNFSMIALGSCTMKLNAASELMPLSWPEFNQLHPFAPKEQASGYHEMLVDLEKELAISTGFDAVSLQPNSGAQGEYAGLMVIRAYHRHRGDEHRDIVLIPSSAHGTNPASAVMAGMQVVVVKCDEQGNIDLDDLRSKAQQYSDRLAALMVTYPSTHGVFEDAIMEINQTIHAHGGQVYMDGANMNAQVGLTSPATIGADVCHLNLHKTFAIPHGGGGPGMGPIGVKQHLAPFLPKHPVVETGGEFGIDAISAAPFGSPLILLISYAYIKMLGHSGERLVTEYAILNANYMKRKLEPHFPVLYSGNNGRVAHEFILDCREFKKVGIEVVDIAKRLMDYGFHAPTVSFPVAGTLMIEPTESESKAELDRFCEALISIREEIREIEQGIYDKTQNVLKGAPHTADVLVADNWDRPYTRTKAAYPLGFVRENKFWPPVSRVDDAYGDRNLICSCLPVEAYEHA
jgi:glycine dehydrogenase